MKKILPLIFAMVLLFFTHGFAQPGPYIGGGLAYNNHLSSNVAYLDPGLGLEFKFGYDFGTVALQGTLFGSRHDDTDPGYGSADFSGFSFDLRIFLNHPNDPSRVYMLVGLGSYSVEEYDPILAADTELNGSGWNLGTGIEHYLNSRTALNFGLVYRFIRYDEFVVDNTVFSLSPDEDGDVLTLEAGVHFHF